MTKENLQALEQLVQEQLEAQRVEESTSPWKSLVFVVKKKSDRWRMLADLTVINKIIQPMGSLQPRIPLPSLLPKEWPIIVIDLKDCFFTIPLHEHDRERFAFSFTRSFLIKKYHWKVLPQGM